ncbi:hypothetical protein C8F04DRAFT_1260430 [Mycena alexandri]|uniref:Uncharacterized protein n=1 Tax=Mycena alexandri TaxID=1745969 RepID=A0AAD6SUZ7_9AGAR|nr:hypothetical protein C8F04DRAFT_1260430 [Mycena alexandri]
MLPLARQQTHTSIHSWWSDSNPGLLGPTLDLHAMAKPLLRRMHDRQALKRIETNHGSPLSSEMLYILSSYLLHDYVFPSTKAAILVKLKRRAALEEDDARSIVDDSIALGQITEMLESPTKELRAAACGVFGSLAQHESITLKTLHINACVRLISLLRGVFEPWIEEYRYEVQKKFGGARAKAFSNVQWMHEQMYLTNITELNLLKPDDLVIFLNASSSEVQLGSVVTMYTKNTMRDWIPNMPSIGTPSYIYVLAYRPFAGAIFTSIACEQYSCPTNHSAACTHCGGAPTITLCADSLALFQKMRESKLALSAAVRDLMQLMKDGKSGDSDAVNKCYMSSRGGKGWWNSRPESYKVLRNKGGAGK